MEFLRCAFDVRAEVKMTAEEMQHLMTQARRHYDHQCITASYPGGFLYGWKNMVEMGCSSMFVTTSQADTICKILEIPGSSNELRSAFVSLSRGMNREYDKVNKVSRRRRG